MKLLKNALLVVLVAFAVFFTGSGNCEPSSTNGTSQTQNQSITVHITKTGKKYHLAGCRYLSHSDITVTLKEAKERGLTPCLVCKPPQ